MIAYVNRFANGIHAVLNMELERVLVRVMTGLVAVLSFSACSIDGERDGAVRTVEVAPGVSLGLPPVAALGRRIQVSQLVTARHGDQTIVFEGHMSSTPDRILLVGLDLIGRRAFTLAWTDAGVALKSAPWLPDGIKPRNMLIDIVLIYWPEESVRALLAGSGVVLNSSRKRRSLLTNGREIIRIDYRPSQNRVWSGDARYHNIAWGYEIEIRSAEVAP